MPDEILKRTNVRLPPRVHAELKSTAAHQNESIEDIVRRAVERELQGGSRGSSAARREHEALLDLQRDLERLTHKLRRVLSGRPSSGELLDQTVQSFFDCLPVPASITDQNGLVSWCNAAYEGLASANGHEAIGTAILFPSAPGEAIERASVTRISIYRDDWWVHRFTIEDGSETLQLGCIAFPANECQAAKRSEVVMSVPVFVKGKVADPRTVPLLKAFLEHLPTVAVLKDLDGRYLWFNPQFPKLLPSDRQGSDTIGKRPEDIFPVRADSLRRREDRVRKEGVAVLATELVGDNVERTALRFPIFDEEGRVAYIGAVSVEPAGFILQPAQAIEPGFDLALDQ